MERGASVAADQEIAWNWSLAMGRLAGEMGWSGGAWCGWSRNGVRDYYACGGWRLEAGGREGPIALPVPTANPQYPAPAG